MKNKFFVLTVKDYLPKDEQLKIEDEIAKYILDLWKNYKISCVFIPTGANPIEENDLPVGERLLLKIADSKIFKVSIPKTPEETKQIIRKSKFAVCTRMHSAIFAITEYKPLIAIAYEHKSIGLLQSLNLQQWYVRMQETTSLKLMKLTEKLLNKANYSSFIHILKKQRLIILKERDNLKLQIINT